MKQIRPGADDAQDGVDRFPEVVSAPQETMTLKEVEPRKRMADSKAQPVNLFLVAAVS